MVVAREDAEIRRWLLMLMVRRRQGGVAAHDGEEWAREVRVGVAGAGAAGDGLGPLRKRRTLRFLGLGDFIAVLSHSCHSQRGDSEQSFRIWGRERECLVFYFYFLFIELLNSLIGGGHGVMQR